MSIGERIKKVRHSKDLTQQEFCEQIGLKRNSISLIESGKRNISDQAIKSICREFNVSETWLRIGEGEMFEPKETDAWDEVVKQRGLTQSDRILIEKFMNLKPSSRQAVMEYMKKVVAALNEETALPGSEPAPAAPERSEPDIAARMAELERQSHEKDKQIQELAAKVAAMEEEELAADFREAFSALQSGLAGSSDPAQKAKK